MNVSARLGPDATPAPTPPEAALAMPSQDLKRGHDRAFGRADARTLAARALAFGGAAALTIWGARQMTLAFDPESVSALQLALRALFVLTFAWIAFAACSALAGALFAPRRVAPSTDGPVPARVAIVMPVYQEDAPETFGALAALAEDLAARGVAEAFEIFVISDTSDPDAWARETTAFAALRDHLSGVMPCWYRRRAGNVGRKAGNVRDFVERWGGRYDLMLMLDADSLMDGETVEAMARRMAAEPRLGLLQTTPRLIGGQTPFARLQQFASALYGGPVARGVAAWQGLDGNFWGHNAMIRVRAFAESAGLPELSGRAPFGGHVMSHDFVEAALLRRAGWGVRMDPDLRGSWEGAPPNLETFAARDRRWMQGNLQHAKVIGARGLRWPSRVHFAVGIGSYVASPVWLGMILVGLALTFQAAWFRPEYFPTAFQLFPSWPRFDAERMLGLFGVSMGLLLAPKAIGLLGALARTDKRRAFGGGPRLIVGALGELIATALMAPVMMILQTGQLADILRGRDAGWAPQAREGEAIAWRDALRLHGWRAAVAAAVALGLWWTQREALIWLSPVLLGLALGPWLARWTGDPERGARLGRARLLATPADTRPPPVAAAAARLGEKIAARAATGLDDLTRHPALARAHYALAPAGLRVVARVDAITADAKARAARDPADALGMMNAAERAALALDPALYAQIVRAGERMLHGPPDTVDLAR